MKTPSKTLPKALFDTLENLPQNMQHAELPHEAHRAEFQISLQFLKSYTGSLGTFNSYRREVERFLQWAWLIRQSSIKTLKRDDIEEYLKFCQHPPLDWIGTKKTPRYLDTLEGRRPNPAWRPFVATISKVAHKEGLSPKASQFSLSQGAISEIFAILSTYYNFLIAEEYCYSNPIALIRQKSKFVRKQQSQAPIRRLSAVQWQALQTVVDNMAAESAEHERSRFMLSLLFGLYLRISELAASPRWTPEMRHFHKDGHGQWWFRTVGKGNKERLIAVSDDVLNSLKRYRQHLGLPALPNNADTSPLIPKIRGYGPMSDTAPLRRIVQRCFDAAMQYLRTQGEQEEADNLAVATVHWLRHTGISEDVKIRPREHVRDDAGHSSSQTTDRYIDVELRARHASARGKSLHIEERFEINPEDAL